MNILHLNDKISVVGGVEVYLDQLQHLLPPKGVGSEWCGISASKDGYEVRVYPDDTPQASGSIGDILSFLKGFIEKHEIDIINIHSISDPELIRNCFHLRPVIRTSHEPRMFCPGQGKFLRFSESVCRKPFGAHCFWDTYLEGCSNRHPLRLLNAYQNTRFEINEASRQYRRIMVMSDYMATESVLAGIPEENLIINPYFTPRTEEVRYHSWEGEKRLLFLGRFISHKGLHIMIEAVLPLLSRHPDLFLDIIGDGIYYPGLKAAISQLQDKGFKQRVVFHGWKGREEIGSFLDNSFLVIFPSIYPEAFGIVGIEAMMHGRPVVGFDVGGVGTWLKDDENGRLVEAGNTGAMTQAIEEILNDRDLYKKYCEKGRQMALESYLPDIHLDNLIKIYQSAL